MGRSLTIRGLVNYSGYGTHVREIIAALGKLGISVKLVGFGNSRCSESPKKKGNSCFDRSDLPINSSVILHFCGPRRVKIAEGMLNVNYTTFESTRIPESWVKHSLSHDLVILTTESAKEAWMESGVPEEHLRICPLGVDADRFHPGVEPLDLGNQRGRRVLEYRARFLNVSAFISAPRKNILGMLRVWIKATNVNDDAILILKLRGGNYRWWWPDKFNRALNAMEREIGKTRKQAAPVLFHNQTLPTSQMPSFYAVGTHYWSMSHGEGWDLPMTEAGAMGLHLIAPKHSAYVTYLDESVAQMVPSRAISADFNGRRELGRLFEGSEWWEPDEETAVECIRQAIRTAGEGSPTARARISRDFTWEKSARRLIEILEELHTRKGKEF